MTMEWQPIETAPKDGSSFLAYEDGEVFRCWVEFSEYEGGYYYQDVMDCEPSPTHWMTLPLPPTGAA